MPGLSMVLNTAKVALSAQQTGLNVSGHNIANVNSPSFSRQTPVQTVTRPVNFGGLNMGTGVSVDSIVRSSDELLENRLIDQNSNLARFEGTKSYMSILENLFNENSETSLSNQLSKFWNGWNALANMPTGSSERLGLYDSGVRAVEQFQSLSDNMIQIQTDIEHEISVSLDSINTITKQIAATNLDIVGNAATSSPNDQLDKRNELVKKLSELLDLQTYRQPNGSLTVATATGHVLVSGVETFQLETRSGRINWVNSHGEGVDITDRIKGGKIGGLLEMRDEIIPEVSQDLNELAKGFIWLVNYQHSQGVGLSFFSDPLTGASKTNSSQMLDTLDFGDKIDYSGDFKLWTQNTNVIPPTFSGINVDMNTANIAVGNWGGAAPGSYQYKVTVTTAGVVGPAGTDPVLSWERFNPNGTTTGVTGTITVTDVNTLSASLNGLTFNIAAGPLYQGNSFTINTNAAGNEASLKLNSVTGTANSVQNTYMFTVKSGGIIGTGPVEIEWHNGAKTDSFILDPAVVPMTAEVDGMTLDFAAGTVFAGDSFIIKTSDNGTPNSQLPSEWHWTLSSFADAFNRAADVAGGGAGLRKIAASVTAGNQLKFTPVAGYKYAFSDDQVQDSGMAAAMGFNTFFTGSSAGSIGVNSVLQNKDRIAAARIDGTTGEHGVGDNRNAINIAGIQNASLQFAQWTYDRRNGDSSKITTLTTEGYYQGLIGAIGIQSAGINRNAQFSQNMMDMITEQRNSISGVNLDEEMINMMKYQHGYAVASKLLTAADEMLQTLLGIK